MSLRREMDHKEAVETMAAQRYVLDEMTPEDQDAFEEHFFGCAECAADIKDSETIADTLRSEKNVVKKFSPRQSQTRWLAIAASFALVAVLGYQNLPTIPGLRRETAVARSPRLVASYYLRESVRAAEQPETVNGSEAFTLDFDFVPPPNAKSVAVDVVDAAGRMRIHQAIAAEQVRDSVHLLVPA